MSKLVSISGVVAYVEDVAKTAAFYESLGFIVYLQETDRVSVRLNWFWIDFHEAAKDKGTEFEKEANLQPKGAGEWLYIKVTDIDDYYQELLKKGLKPSSEPRDWSWGNREFVIRDPDGYKLAFFQKSK
jgi:catechol 2,3-dioxygenase-like lactoylglutathione lyase family enzyme